MTGKLMPDASLNPTSLVVGAIANAFALSSVLYIAWEISGGHVNPAVTFAMAVGGHISVPTALFYWVAQLIASVIACLFLKVIVVGMVFFLPLSFSSTSLFQFSLVLTQTQSLFLFLVKKHSHYYYRHN
jgi:glycerol uptake facilitator-like aquaporin